MSSTYRGAERKKQDAYQTPAWCVDMLLAELDLRSNPIRFLEPCRGRGAIYDRVPATIKGWCEIDDGRDYLDIPIKPGRFDLIITNPPYSLALPFLKKSLGEGRTVIYLLRVNFLGSSERAAFWQANPLTHLFIITPRPSFTGSGSDATEYAWFYWDRAGLVRRAAGI